ncbi:ribose-phosphate pyrophosphokinase [Spiroplasma clarkii]|uniref:ribose-phosphate diphosphokinase n=1 Tax=Spiroplasma clarkii TaxID=2139 RepID=A0A1Y0KZJ1_9MOLU|nr:ribose-phosphate diphosphokinase [Spiroplasma clarkii]ARU90879.1 ribose-phosphate pyrophosphokinase [Spiroplasma clarkii]ATX71668.1 ribose-phosphate pyrophosphokinase [Spiroplasma clarkii]
MEKDNIKIFGLSASKELTDKICKVLGVEPAKLNTKRFMDGETLVELVDSVRGQEVYVIQATNTPVNDNYMELLIAVDAFKRASAGKINVVIPYYGYARQDRKAKGRQPITARLMANLLETAGVDRIITVDIHSAQAMGFFNIPMDNFSTAQTVASEIIDTIIEEQYLPSECILVSPDHGGLNRVHGVAEYTRATISGIAVIAKRRPEPNKSEVEFVLGDIENKICFIVDDMIDTGGTIINGARALKKAGAKEIYIIACHGLFNGDAKAKMCQAIEEKIVKRVIVTDTVEIPEERRFKELKIITVSNLIANMILSSYEKESLTNVYNDFKNSIIKRVEKHLKGCK